MKKIIMVLAAAIAALSFSSCVKLDPWTKGDPSQDHVYFIGFNWGSTSKDFNKNGVKYDVTQGNTLEIPYKLESAFVRDYDVVTYYYIESSLVNGTDYVVVDENGTTLTPAADGSYPMNWPQAKGEIKKIYLKALNGTKGTLKVKTIGSDHVTPSSADLSTLIQHETSQYTIRIFSLNYYVTVTIK